MNLNALFQLQFRNDSRFSFLSNTFNLELKRSVFSAHFPHTGNCEASALMFSNLIGQIQLQEAHVQSE